MTASIRILTTHSLDTSPSLLLISPTGYTTLINCGEGCQRTFLESKDRIKRINRICITRISHDEVGGLPGMILTGADVSEIARENGLMGGDTTKGWRYRQRMEERKNRGNKRPRSSNDYDYYSPQPPPPPPPPAAADDDDDDDDKSSTSATGNLELLGPKGMTSFIHSLRHFMRRDKFNVSVREGRYKSENVCEIPADTRDNRDRRSGNKRRHYQQQQRGRKQKDEKKELKDGFMVQSLAYDFVVTLPSAAGESSTPSVATIEVVSFLFTTPRIPGSLNPTKAKSLGVSPGPLFAKLKNGHDVTVTCSETGEEKIVKSADCVSGGCAGVCVAVLCVPSREVWMALKEEECWRELREGPVELDCVVHMTNRVWGECKEYREWMKGLGEGVQHVMIYEGEGVEGGSPFYAGCLGAMTRNMIHEEIFPRVSLGCGGGGDDEGMSDEEKKMEDCDGGNGVIACQSTKLNEATVDKKVNAGSYDTMNDSSIKKENDDEIMKVVDLTDDNDTMEETVDESDDKATEDLTSENDAMNETDEKQNDNAAITTTDDPIQPKEDDNSNKKIESNSQDETASAVTVTTSNENNATKEAQNDDNKCPSDDKSTSTITASNDVENAMNTKQNDDSDGHTTAAKSTVANDSGANNSDPNDDKSLNTTVVMEDEANDVKLENNNETVASHSGTSDETADNTTTTNINNKSTTSPEETNNTKSDEVTEAKKEDDVVVVNDDEKVKVEDLTSENDTMKDAEHKHDDEAVTTNNSIEPIENSNEEIQNNNNSSEVAAVTTTSNENDIMENESHASTAKPTTNNSENSEMMVADDSDTLDNNIKKEDKTNLEDNGETDISHTSTSNETSDNNITTTNNNSTSPNKITTPTQKTPDDNNKSSTTPSHLKIINAQPMLTFHLIPRSKKGLDLSQSPSRVTPHKLSQRSQKPNIQNAINLARTTTTTPTSPPSSNEGELVFTGTGSSLPCKHRNVSGIYLRMTNGNAMMLDVGEGTTGQLFRLWHTEEERRERVGAIKAIWISHPHADHHLGLFRLLTLHHAISPSNPLLLIAPAPLFRFLSEYSLIDPTISNSYTPIDAKCLLLRNPTPHTPTTTLSPKAYFRDELNLTSVLTLPVAHCANSHAILLANTPFGNLAYSGDCRPSDSLINAARNETDVLIHEATFEDGMESDAVLKRHSTVGEALTVGRKMRARNVILTHFSQRYPKMQTTTTTVKKKEEGEEDDMAVVMAFDFMRLRPGDLRVASELTPALKMLYQREEEEEEEEKEKTTEEKKRKNDGRGGGGGRGRGRGRGRMQHRRNGNGGRGGGGGGTPKKQKRDNINGQQQQQQQQQQQLGKKNKGTKITAGQAIMNTPGAFAVSEFL